LESAVRTVCEPIFNKPLKDISFAQVLMRLFQVARRFDMQIQPQLILLQKTLVQIEGLGRDLYPDLDLWETGQPVLKRWMTEQTGPRATAKRIARDLPDIRYTLERLPEAARQLVDQVLDNEGKLPLPDARVMRAREQRQFRVVAGAAALVSGALLIGLGAQPAWLGWLVGAVGIASLLAGRPRD
jgi:ubiquinone biosynthesis protein